MGKSFLAFVTDELQAHYGLTEREIGSYNEIRKNGMHFSIRAYEIKGIGRMSTIAMKAMFGLMCMETIVLTPLSKDAPLFSYDLVRAMGNDTLLLELYDTQLAAIDVDALDQIKSNASTLPDHDLGKKWYDHLKLSPSLAKRGKKLTDAYRSLCEAYFHAYLTLLDGAADCDANEKQAATHNYVNGLLTNGGPSTDQFKKMIGEDATRELFTKYIFSSQD